MNKAGAVSSSRKKGKGTKGTHGTKVAAEHTPGPWCTYFGDTPLTPITCWKIKATYGAGTPIALVLEPRGGTKVNGYSPFQEANARLIAAAPGLLTHSAALLDYLEKFFPDEPLFGFDHPAEMIEGLRRAIKQARGQA